MATAAPTDRQAKTPGCCRGNRVWTFAAVAVAAFCLISIAWIDIPVAHWAASLRGTDVHTVFNKVTRIGLGVWYFEAGGGLLFIFTMVRLFNASPTAQATAERYIRLCAFFLLSLIVAGIAVNLLKFGFGRIRPDIAPDAGFSGFHGLGLGRNHTSFPSGHSQLIWTVAVSLSLMFPRFLIAFVAVAITIAASRVLIDVHFVSDVVAGAYVGAIVPVLIKGHLFDARGIYLDGRDATEPGPVTETRP